MANAINPQADGNTFMVGMTPITRENLDSGKIVHTGWALCGQSTLLMDPRPEIQCDVQPGMYFDASGKFLGPDENGLEPTFFEAE